MQVFGNVATQWEKKTSKTTSKGYWQGRIAESQRGVDTSPTFYTVRLMVDKDPELKLGDFVRVTGKLKVDYFIGRDGLPSGSLLIIAFEAFKVSKHATKTGDDAEASDTDGDSKSPTKRQLASASVSAQGTEPARQEEPVAWPQPARGSTHMQMIEWTD